MRFYSKSQKKWQKNYIKTVFDSSNDKKKNFSKIILQNLEFVNEKNKHLPDYLFKYYAPTSENILDIKYKRLWLSHPTQFNDPFDCNIGYDKDSYDKKCLIDFIEKSNFFENNETSSIVTLEEKNRLLKSHSDEISYWDPKKESYIDAKRKILDSKNDELQRKIYQYIDRNIKDVDIKIEKLKNTNIRVAYFSKLDKYDEFFKQISMWSHYADNHKGFCVEYDISSLKDQMKLSINDFYNKRDDYLNERSKLLIKAGLFPVIYTSGRINIPKTKLSKITFNEFGEINYNTNIDELIYKAFIVKSANWNYEKEWRIIIDGKICDFFNNKIPFPYIKKIYLGCKASKELTNTMIEIGNEVGAEVLILRMDGKKFILEDLGSWNYKFENDRKFYKNPFNF